MRCLTLIVVIILTFYSVGFAQGPVNPSTITWTAPVTNADGSPLLDMGEYRVRVAGPAPTAPSFNTTVYPVKATKVSTVQAPTVNSTVVYGTAGSANLAGDLGLTQDGQYWVYLTAVDIAGNESGVQGTPSPFVRNRQTPSAPTGIRIDQ